MNIKKVIVGVLTVAFAVTSLVINFENTDKVSGSEAKTIIYEKMDISSYRKDDFTAPYKKGYVFGGWYYGEDNTEPLSDETKTGKAYAKFVPEDVLKVYCQNSDGTVKKTSKTNVRLVTSVDSDIYQKVGFDITVYGKTKTEYNYELDKIYKKISITSGKDIISIKDNRLFSKASKYFVTLKLININNEGFDVPYLVRAYWMTQDGTKVYGPDKYTRVRNGFDGSFSVPIRINDGDKNIAASLLSISYDNEKLVYEGYDCGELFDSCKTRDNNGTIRILAGNSKMDKNATASGYMGSLNFRVKNYDTEEEQFDFNVIDAQFCDVSENIVDVQDVKIKSVNK